MNSLELSIDDLIPYIRNPRKNDEAATKVAASIKEFGFKQPIVVDKNMIIVAGHTRLLAAQKLGLKKVPVIIADDLTESQIKAYRIADNRVAEEAEWDYDLLKLEINDLVDLDFDLIETGFSQDELDNILNEKTDGLTDPDEVPEAPEEPTTKLGDIYILGNHRLMCGDSTSIDAVETLMDGQKADMVFTDPPYGMSYGGGRAAVSTSKGAKLKAHGMIIGDDKTGSNLITLIRDALVSVVTLCKTGASKYICFPWRTYSEFESALNECGLIPTACIVWDKKSIGLGQANYRPQHEFIFYIKGDTWHGDKAQSDVWYLSRGATSKYVHPTQKPVELIEKAVNNSSKGGDNVVDVFGGSGSTLIACEKSGRNAYLMELDPKYCDVIVKRWENFTGKKAALINREGTNIKLKEVVNG